MIDAITKERLTVNGEALTGSNIIVPLEQVDAVTSALTAAGVKFWAKEVAPLYDDEVPTVAVVSLSRTSNTAEVQRLLDRL